MVAGLWRFRYSEMSAFLLVRRGRPQLRERGGATGPYTNAGVMKDKGMRPQRRSGSGNLLLAAGIAADTVELAGPGGRAGLTITARSLNDAPSVSPSSASGCTNIGRGVGIAAGGGGMFTAAS